MNIQEDFEEFLRLLNAESAEYVIVGGYAVTFYVLHPIISAKLNGHWQTLGSPKAL